MLALFAISGRFSACPRKGASRTVFALDRSSEAEQDFLWDTGLHFPVRIPKAAPSILFLCLFSGFQSPLLATTECFVLRDHAGQRSLWPCFVTAMLLSPSVLVSAHEPRAVDMQTRGHVELGNVCLALGLAASGSVVGGRWGNWWDGVMFFSPSGKNCAHRQKTWLLWIVVQLLTAQLWYQHTYGIHSAAPSGIGQEPGE